MATEGQSDRRFENIFSRLNALEKESAEFGQWKDRVDMDLYNHGKDGMKTILTQFIADHKAREEERESQRIERERKRDRTLSLISVVIGVMSVIVVAIGVLVSWMAYISTITHVKAGDLKMPYTFLSKPDNPMAATTQPPKQDAAASIY